MRYAGQKRQNKFPEEFGVDYCVWFKWFSGTKCQRKTKQPGDQEEKETSTRQRKMFVNQEMDSEPEKNDMRSCPKQKGKGGLSKPQETARNRLK